MPLYLSVARVYTLFFWEPHGLVNSAFVQKRSYNRCSYSPCSIALLEVILAMQQLSSATDVIANRKFSVTKFQSAICICCWAHRLQFQKKEDYFTCERISPFSSLKKMSWFFNYDSKKCKGSNLHKKFIALNALC